MARAALVALEPEWSESLRRSPLLASVELEPVASADEALKQAVAQPELFEAWVVGPDVEQPVTLAQRVYQRDRSASVLILVPASRLDEVQERLAIAPFIGPETRCRSMEEMRERLDAELCTAIEVTQRRRTFAGTVQGLSSKLSASPVLQPQSVGFLDTLFELAPVGILALDSQAHILLGNRAVLSLLEVRQEELVGRPLSSLFPPEEAGRLEGLLHQASGSGEPLQGPFERDSSRGRQVLEVRVASVQVREGELGFLAILQDVTERTRAERERAALIAQLDEAVRSRDEFLSVASHELKTPLTAFHLQLELIRRAMPPESQKQLASRLAMAQRQVTKLAGLVESLLDVSRVATGRLELQLSDVDLTLLVHDALDRMQGTFAQAGCGVAFHGEGPVVGRWDALRLEQVVNNLLSNAAKYGAGGPVSVSVGTEAGRARLTVKDAGIGIAPEDVRRIFGRFERAVSERHYGGLGLGLYISLQLVEAMAGTIEVESQKGEGSAFTVWLPLRPDAPGTS
jgi:PAS domain S-box-containing protein